MFNILNQLQTAFTQYLRGTPSCRHKIINSNSGLQTILIPTLAHDPPNTLLRRPELVRYRVLNACTSSSGHQVISIMASGAPPPSAGCHISCVHGEAAPTPQRTKNKGAGRMQRGSCPVNSVLKTPISCFNQLISSTNAKLNH